jgi:hypothetical protein
MTSDMTPHFGQVKVDLQVKGVLGNPEPIASGDTNPHDLHFFL